MQFENPNTLAYDLYDHFSALKKKSMNYVF